MPVAVLANSPSAGVVARGARTADGAGSFPTKTRAASTSDMSNTKAEANVPGDLTDQNRKLQDFAAVKGRSLALGGPVDQNGEPSTSDLLLYAAGGKGPKPPSVPNGGGAKPSGPPEVIMGPDGKPVPAQPPKTTPEVGIPDPLPPKPPDYNLDGGCKVVQAQCNKGCDKVPIGGKKTLITLPLKGLCYAGCAAIYGLCRLSGMISKGAD